MPTCSAFGCTNTPTKQDPGITFHRFPQQTELRGLWVKALRRRNFTPSNSAVVCSEHFEEDSFDRASCFVRLKQNSVPSIFKALPNYPEKNYFFSLPTNLCLNKPLPGQGWKVLSKEAIPIGTRFGPCEGASIEKNEQENGHFQWKLGTKEDIKTLDGSNENNSNWLQYVNYACNREEQNLVALQHNSTVYYVTCKPIPANTELKVWYKHIVVEDGISQEKEYTDNKNDCIKSETRQIKNLECNSQLSKSFQIMVLKERTCSELSKNLVMGKRIKLPKKVSSVFKQAVKPNDPIKGKDTKLISTKSMEVNRETCQTIIDGKSFMYSKTLMLVEEEKAHEKGNKDASVNNFTLNEKTRGSEIKSQSISSQRKCKIKKNKLLHEITHSDNTSHKLNANSNEIKPCSTTKTKKFIHISKTNYPCKTVRKRHKLRNEVKVNKGSSAENLYKGCLVGKKYKSYNKLNIDENHWTENSKYEHKDSGKKCKPANQFKDLDNIDLEQDPCECKACGRKFVNSGNLKIHNRIHTGEKPYKCHECGKNFTQKIHLWTHFKVHSGEKPYRCHECGKKFNQMSHLRTHFKVHSGEKPHICHECGKKFTQRGNLKTHLMVHSDEKPYNCNKCEKKFKLHHNLKLHERIHTGEKRYKCRECGKKFVQNSHLMKHLNVHVQSEKPHRCHECGKKFTQRVHLKMHLMVHTEEKPYNCNKCEKKFKSCDQLKIHEGIHTDEKPPYGCHKCGKKFNQRGSLMAHLAVHSDKKPYSCNICEKKFKLRCHLWRHEIIHTGEKPYGCDKCGKKFSQRGTIINHLVVHSDQKPYSCNICEKKFKMRGYLKLHERIHTGEKPYECHECGKKFNQHSNLKTHMIVHSGERR